MINNNKKKENQLHICGTSHITLVMFAALNLKILFGDLFIRACNSMCHTSLECLERFIHMTTISALSPLIGPG